MKLLCKLFGHELDFAKLIEDFPEVHCPRCGHGGRITIENVENQINTESQYEHTFELEFPRMSRIIH